MPIASRSARGSSLLDAARLVMVAALLLSAFESLPRWHQLGRTSAVSVTAQVFEMIGCMLALWRPWWGTAVFAVPMLLTLVNGPIEADLFLLMCGPGAVVVAARSWRSLAALMAFPLYGLAVSLLYHEVQAIRVYLTFNGIGVAIGLALRMVLAAQRRAQARIGVLSEDLSTIRANERSGLAAELRSVITVRLAESWRILQGTQGTNNVEALRRAMTRVSESCGTALTQVRSLVSMLREDPTAEGTDESLVDPPASMAIDQLHHTLKDAGVQLIWHTSINLDTLAKVDQRTLIRAISEIANATLHEQLPTATIEGTAERKIGRTIFHLTYPSAVLPDPRHEERLNQLSKRIEALGGSLQVYKEDGQRHLHLELLRNSEPSNRDDTTTWRRRLTPGLMHTILTVTLAIPMVLEANQALTNANPPWSSIARALGYASVIALLWWPAIGGISALLAIIALLFTPDLDVIPLLILVCFGSWYLAKTQNRRLIATVIAAATLILGVIFLTTATTARIEPALVSTALLLLPGCIAAHHFIAARKKNLDEATQLSQQAETVRIEQRNLLARELHDVVAHHLSIITLQHMAYGDSSDPAEIRHALDRMERATQAAEEEMDTLSQVMSGTGTTKPDKGSLVRPATIAAALVENLQSGGFTVTMNLDPGVDELPDMTQRTLSRVMQEGTTNILRYSQPRSHCTFNIRVSPTDTQLDIISQLPTRQRTSSLSLGYGLTGIRERVGLSGGTFKAGPHNNNWIIHIDLPHPL